MNWKDILLGLLAGYMVVDIMMSVMSKQKLPSVFEKVFSMIEDTNVMISLGVGVAVGALVWYLCSKEDSS